MCMHTHIYIHYTYAHINFGRCVYVCVALHSGIVQEKGQNHSDYIERLNKT